MKLSTSTESQSFWKSLAGSCFQSCSHTLKHMACAATLLSGTGGGVLHQSEADLYASNISKAIRRALRDA